MPGSWVANINKFLHDERHELSQLASYITSRVQVNSQEAEPHDEININFHYARPTGIYKFVRELFVMLHLYDEYYFNVYTVTGDHQIDIYDYENTYPYITNLTIIMVKK